jgi:hypothetical protein
VVQAATIGWDPRCAGSCRNPRSLNERRAVGACVHDEDGAAMSADIIESDLP